MIIKLKYIDDADTAQVQEFDTLNYKDVPSTEKVNGISKRGRAYSHVLSSRKKYSLVISADQLIAPIKQAFVEVFFTREVGWISTDDGTTWVMVIMDGGDMQKEYVNGIRKLVQVSLQLTQSDPG